jgi:hypothetical protein
MLNLLREQGIYSDSEVVEKENELKQSLSFN